LRGNEKEKPEIRKKEEELEKKKKEMKKDGKEQDPKPVQQPIMVIRPVRTPATEIPTREIPQEGTTPEREVEQEEEFL